MKKCIAILLMIVGENLALAENNMESNKYLVATVIQNLGEKSIDAFPDPSPILGLLETSPSFKMLCENSKTTWTRSLSELSSNRVERLVLLHSYLYLPPKEYMNCLEHILDLYQKGKIQKDEIMYIFLFSPRDETQWFLSYNAEEPQMINFLNHARVAFSQDKGVTHMIDFIVTGKARVRDERIRKDNIGLSKRKVPRLSDQ